MKTLKLFFLLAFSSALMPLFGQSSEMPRYSTGTVVVNLSDPNEMVMHISSGAGYEVKRFVEVSRYRSSPYSYRNWIPMTKRHPYDLTALHQQIDSLLVRGWELVSSNYATSIDFSDINTIDRERLFFQFKTPVPEVPLVSDPESYTLLLEAEVDESLRGSRRGRLIRLQDGTHRVVVDRRSGMGWETAYEQGAAGTLKPEFAESITGLKISNAHITLICTLPEGEYSYQFRRQAGAYVLIKVDFRGQDNCGVIRYAMNLVAYPEATISGRYQQEPCNPKSNGKSFNRQLDRPVLKLRDFVPGNNGVTIPKLDTGVVY